MSFGPEWTTPPPPSPPGAGGGREPIRTGQVWAGIGLAVLGHLATIGVPMVMVFGGIAGDQWTTVGLVAQLLLFIVCLTVGVILLNGPRRRGVGLGLLIGWGVGVIVLPVVGFGACVYAYSQLNH